MFKVSQSKIKTWRRCKYAYHLKYHEKLVKNVKSRPLQFGTIVHEMDDVYHEGDDPFDKLNEIAKKQSKLFRAEIEEYGDIIADVRILYKEYMETYKNDEWDVIRIKKKSSEHEFEVPLNKHILFTGKIDRLVNAKKMRWLVEKKTFGHGMPNDDERWRNLQSASYITMMKLMSWPEVDGTCWDYFSSHAPTMPQLLKNGEISTKNINTLPSKVLEFAKLHKLTPKQVKPLLIKAEARRPEYFKRVYTIIKPKLVNSIMADVMETADEMANNDTKLKAKNIDKHCGWCDFEKICRAELQGSDVKFIREREYHVETFKKVRA